MIADCPGVHVYTAQSRVPQGDLRKLCRTCVQKRHPVVEWSLHSEALLVNLQAGVSQVSHHLVEATIDLFRYPLIGQPADTPSVSFFLCSSLAKPSNSSYVAEHPTTLIAELGGGGIHSRASHPLTLYIRFYYTDARQ